MRPLLASNSLVDARVLLSHVDCNLTARLADGSCPITPCRHAILVESNRIGDFYFLKLELEEFAPCDATINQSHFPTDRPRWTLTNTLEGLWCMELPHQIDSCQRDGRLEGWQRIIRVLGQSLDFSCEPFFFAVEGLYARGSTAACEVENGEYVLRSETDYCVKLFHYHPDGDKHVMTVGVGTIKVDVSSPQLESITSPTLPIESP